mmetsp:Transcript_25682/g.59202  ORF Transcript_25682/g.59202 Transcript_25682/m.59202 type:complete len:229 (-) Transcript_25682:149-835(-)
MRKRATLGQFGLPKEHLCASPDHRHNVGPRGSEVDLVDGLNSWMRLATPDDLHEIRVLGLHILEAPRKVAESFVVINPRVAHVDAVVSEIRHGHLRTTHALAFAGPVFADAESEVTFTDVVLALSHKAHQRIDVLIHGGAVHGRHDECNLFADNAGSQGITRHERVGDLSAVLGDQISCNRLASVDADASVEILQPGNGVDGILSQRLGRPQIGGPVDVGKIHRKIEH